MNSDSDLVGTLEASKNFHKAIGDMSISVPHVGTSSPRHKHPNLRRTHVSS